MISYQRYPDVAIAAHEPGVLTDQPPISKRYHRRPYNAAKRAMDIVVSSIALLVLFPVFLIISVAIAVTDGFPIVFRQKRLGRDGREFYIYKFRTMVRNAEDVLRSRPELMKEYLETFKITNDPRISKLGRFLRKSTLDELPQLVNVLVGEMSLIGPRPIVPKEIEKYGDSSWVYLSMKPGCGGLWQSSGRSEVSYAERVNLDILYYERAGLRYDVLLLWKTALAVLRARGAS